MSTPIFISIQASYTQLQIALFKGNICSELITEHNRQASSILIPLIKKILDKNSIAISNLHFICIDQGPGAFTSLRVAITTVNGISFASKVPLIGIDGLDALAQETAVTFKSSQDSQIIIPLLNAYNNEVYYACYTFITSNTLELLKDIKPSKGYKKIDKLLPVITNKFDKKTIIFTGNGAILHKSIIEKKLKSQKIKIFNKDVCSVNQIAKMALEKYQKKEGFESKLYPLYLKSQRFAIKLRPNTSHTS